MKTIKQNESSTTLYLLTIDELVELCQDYNQGIEGGSPTEYIELYVDYLLEKRPKPAK